MLVNFNHLLYRKNRAVDEPFILASQAEQVRYVQDPLEYANNLDGINGSKIKPLELSACSSLFAFNGDKEPSRKYKDKFLKDFK